MTRRPAIARFGLMFGSALLAACSAMGLGDVDLIACDPDDSDGDPECDALNAELADGCARYYCSTSGRGCVLELRDDDRDGFMSRDVCSEEVEEDQLDCDDGARLRNPDQDESCDGIDNDCDRWIDEDTEPSYADEPAEIDEGVEDVSSATSGGTLHVLLTREEPLMRGFFSTEHIAAPDVEFGDRTELFAGQKCPSPEPIDCQLSQLAIAATPDIVVGAGIHSSSCIEGQLRLGIGSTREFDLELGEGTERAGLGVDLEPERSCTASSDCMGASAPAVAVLEPSTLSSISEALFVWLAPTAEGSADCDSASAFQLRALGLAIEGSRAPFRLRPPSDGRSERLGDGIASGPAAVVASARVSLLASTTATQNTGGYFIAFPSGDRVEVMFVPRRAGRDRIGSDFVQTGIDAPGSSHVAIAVEASSTLGLAVAFRAQLDTGAALQLVALALDQGDEPHIDRIDATTTLEIKGEIAAGPVLSYAPVGFAVADGEGPTGGWLVAWVERGPGGDADDRLMAARIAELPQRTLGAPFEVARGSLTEPFTYLKQAGDTEPSLHCGYLANEKIHLERVSCDIGN